MESPSRSKSPSWVLSDIGTRFPSCREVGLELLDSLEFLLIRHLLVLDMNLSAGLIVGRQAFTTPRVGSSSE